MGYKSWQVSKHKIIEAEAYWTPKWGFDFGFGAAYRYVGDHPGFFADLTFVWLYLSFTFCDTRHEEDFT